jgi:DNA-binding Xre family transcriptional regulator
VVLCYGASRKLSVELSIEKESCTVMSVSQERNQIEKTGKLAFLVSCDTIANTMMRLRVREVAELDGVKSPTALKQRTGINYEVCRQLWSGDTQMVALRTLEKLCIAFQVPPAQFLEFKPDTVEEPAQKKAKSKTK